MVSSVVRASMDRDSISMEPEVQEATVQLREFLFEQVYLNPRAKGQESKAQELVKTLFGYYVTHPDRMPELYRRLAAEGGAGGAMRVRFHFRHDRSVRD